MPDLISIANNLKTAPDKWLVEQSQRPSGTTPPYLVLAELQRRQMLRGGGDKPPSTSVAQDTLAATMKQLQPPQPPSPPPPPGMAPPSKDIASTGEPVPGAKPPQNMKKGGVFDDDDDRDELPYEQLSKMPVQDLIRYYSDYYKIDPRIPLTIGQLESGYKTGRVSPKGARGPMQVMPDTFREMGGKNINDVVQNVKAGVKYTKIQHDKYGGDFEKTLAAYNAGPGAVDKHKGVPPYPETKNYVKLGHKAMKQFKPPDRPPREPIKELGYLDTMHLNTGVDEPEIPFDQEYRAGIYKYGGKRRLQGPDPRETMWAGQNVGRWQGPLAGYKPEEDPVRSMAPRSPKPEPFVYDQSRQLARGPLELPQPEAPMLPGALPMVPGAPFPGAPSGLASAEPPAPGAGPGGLGAAAGMWKPPESAELVSARKRRKAAEETLATRKGAYRPYDPNEALEEDNVKRVRTAVSGMLSKEVDYSELEAAISELQGQAERSLQPDIGLTLRTMGFALLASHQPNFGAALGEAGLHTQGVIEKQRREARSDYIAALKAGVDLQTKKGERQDKVADLTASQIKAQQAAGLQEQKDALRDIEDKHNELITATDNEAKAETAFRSLTDPTRDEQLRAEALLANEKKVRDPKLSPVDQVLRDMPDKAGMLTSASQAFMKPPTEKEQKWHSVLQRIAEENDIKLPDKPQLTDLPTEFHEKANEMAYDAMHPPIEMDDSQIKYWAQAYRQGVALPSGLTRGAQARKVVQKIMQEVAEQGAREDKSLALTVAEGKADAGTLKKRVEQLSAVTAFEETALANFDLMVKTAVPVIDLNSPWMNKPLREVSIAGLGSEELAALNAARQVALTEIAKVTSNPNLNGQLTDSARHEIMNLIPQEATYKQIVAVGKILKQDMVNRKTKLQDEIARIEARLGGKAPPSAAAGGKTATRADVQAAADARFKGDYAKAEAAFKKAGYTIQ